MGFDLILILIWMRGLFLANFRLRNCPENVNRSEREADTIQHIHRHWPIRSYSIWRAPTHVRRAECPDLWTLADWITQRAIPSDDDAQMAGLPNILFIFQSLPLCFSISTFCELGWGLDSVISCILIVQVYYPENPRLYFPLSMVL